MLKRKAFAFLLTIIVAMPINGFVIMLIERGTITDVLGLMIFTSLYTIPVTLLFGLPVSILSDKINDRLDNKKRIFSAAITHLLFTIGLVTLFIFITESRFLDINEFDTYFLDAAIVGWAMNEFIRCGDGKKTEIA